MKPRFLSPKRDWDSFSFQIYRVKLIFMPTPSPGNPISMNDVYLETNLTRSMDNFFDVANIGGGGGLMYHNLSMGPGASQSAKVAVFDRFNAGTDMNLSAWYNYTQDADMHFTYNFLNNNTENNVDVNLFFDDGTLTAPVPVVSFTVPNNGGTQNAEINTGLPANTTFPGGLYIIVANISATFVGPGRPPGGGVSGNVADAFDTDGVGPGTFRQGNAPPGFDAFNPINFFIIAEGNISGASIYNNKRTTLDVEFN
jgi:hypothetical protein